MSKRTLGTAGTGLLVLAAVLAAGCDVDPVAPRLTAIPRLNVTGDGCVPPPSGLVSWWRAENDATDATGGRHGSFIGAGAYATGVVGQAFSFDGGNLVEIPDSPAWTLGANPFTIEMWVNFVFIQGRDAFMGHDEGGGETNKWIFWFDVAGHDTPGGDALRFHLNSANHVPTGPTDPVAGSWTPVPQRWYHVAITRSGTTYALYVDGQQTSTSTNAVVIPDPNAAMTIGSAEGFRFVGLIDEVSFYSRGLASSEIGAIHGAGSAGKCVASGTTPSGEDVVVLPTDVTTGLPAPIQVTFGDVDGGGTTTVTSSTIGGTGGPPAPADFKLGNPPTYYDIETTAVVAAGSAIEVCIDYSGASFGNESRLKLLHYNATTARWEDITSSLDASTNVICGITTSLSPFLAAELPYAFTGFFQPVDNPGDAAPFVVNKVKAGAAIPVKFSLGGDVGLDLFVAGSPSSAGYTCTTSAEDLIEQTVAASVSGLRYDAPSGQYIYVWKTDSKWAGTCRKLSVALKDGSIHEALFSFVK